MTAAILGGTITYGRTIKPADFESKKAEVTLTFGIEQDTPAEERNDFLVAIGNQAMHHCNRMLGLHDQAVEPAPAAEPARRGRKSKDEGAKPAAENPFGGEKTQEPASEAIPPANTGDFGAQTAEGGQPSQDGAGQTATGDASRSDFGGATTAQEPAQQDFSVPAEMPATEWTDVALTAECNKVVSKLGKADSMLEILRTYIKTGETQRAIPADKRQEFVDKINALTA